MNGTKLAQKRWREEPMICKSLIVLEAGPRIELGYTDLQCSPSKKAFLKQAFINAVPQFSLFSRHVFVTPKQQQESST